MWSLFRSPFWVSKVSFWSPFNQIRSPKVGNGWFFFLNFWVGGETILSLDPGAKTGSNLSSQEKPSKRLILLCKLQGLSIESRRFTLWRKYFWPSWCLGWWWFWCGAFCVVSLWFILLQRSPSLFFLCPRMWTWTCLFEAEQDGTSNYYHVWSSLKIILASVEQSRLSY